MFADIDFSNQRMKIFVYNLWSWSRVHTDMRSCFFISFIDWLSSQYGQVMLSFGVSPFTLR